MGKMLYRQGSMDRYRADPEVRRAELDRVRELRLTTSRPQYLAYQRWYDENVRGTRKKTPLPNKYVYNAKKMEQAIKKLLK